MNETGRTVHGDVQIQGVTKRFGTTLALDAVDLAIPSGAFFSLLGPSGCGKTTLLRIIAGLERPDSGAVLSAGDDVTHLAPERRPFNTVFQSYALFPHLTVAENVGFGLTTGPKRRRPSAVERSKRVEQMLSLVHLDGFGTRLPGELSGGQAQRVAVARALVNQPAVLLLDEPLSALDRNVRFALREELQRIHRELGTTFVLVTHDQEEALSVSSTVGLMRDGTLEQVCDPQTLYRTPATLFAARFVGAGSFVAATVESENRDRVTVSIGPRRFSATRAAPLGPRAVVLLRPEELDLTPDGPLAGAVETCSFHGSTFELVVALSTGGTVRTASNEPLEPGTAVALDVRDEAGIAYPDDGPQDEARSG